MSGFKLTTIALKKPSPAASAAVSKPKVISSVFGGGKGEDDDSDDDSGSKRPDDQRTRIARVNKELEERAKRAEEESRRASQAAGLDPDLFDYDGSYDRLKGDSQGSVSDSQVLSSIASSGDWKVGHAATDQPVQLKSRYIDNLHQAVKLREREADRAKERRLLREKLQESKDNPDIPEVSFITSAYKEKLKEREMWEKEDVRKVGMAAFYSNASKNIALGADVQSSSTSVYTAGGQRIQNILASASSMDAPSSSTSGSSELVNATVLSIDNSSRKRDINDAMLDASVSVDINNSNSVLQNDDVPLQNPPILAPVISKEEKLMTAKERYLARKQQKVQSDSA
jgi:hypothetical protein